MEDTLQDTESPLFLNAVGESLPEVSKEIARLNSQRARHRKIINDAKEKKERIGASIIKCKGSKQGDCSELEYNLQLATDEYYKMLGTSTAIENEIKRLQNIHARLRKQVKSKKGVLVNTGMPIMEVPVKKTITRPVGFKNAVDLATLGAKTVTILGATFTYKEAAAFALSLVMVSFALAFPLKTPTEIES